MTESSERTGGLDRRSVIKKGLIIGGVAAAVPVISTFNTPAFAASAPSGTVTRAQFNILASVSALNVVIGVLTSPVTPQTATPCGLTGWSGATDATGGTVAGQGSLLSLDGSGTLTYTSTTCTFTAGARTAGGGCVPGVISNGGHTITFVLPTVSVNLFENVFLLLSCP